MACYKAVVQFRKDKSACSNNYSEFSTLLVATIPGVRMISDMFDLIETLFERHARACPDSADIKYLCGGAPFDLFKNLRLDQCGIISDVPIGYDGNTRLAMVNLKSWYRGEEITLPIFVFTAKGSLKKNSLLKIDLLTLYEAGFVMMYPSEETCEIRTERLMEKRRKHFTLVNRAVGGQGIRYMELQMPRDGCLPIRLMVHGTITVKKECVPYYGQSTKVLNFIIHVAPGDISDYLFAVTGSRQITGQFRMDGHETKSMQIFREIMQDPLGSLQEDVGKHKVLKGFYDPLLVTNSDNVDHLETTVNPSNRKEVRNRKVVVQVDIVRAANRNWMAQVREIAPLLHGNIEFRRAWAEKNGCAQVFVTQNLNSVFQHGEMPLQLSRLMVHLPRKSP